MRNKINFIVTFLVIIILVSTFLLDISALNMMKYEEYSNTHLEFFGNFFYAKDVYHSALLIIISASIGSLLLLNYQIQNRK